MSTSSNVSGASAGGPLARLGRWLWSVLSSMKLAVVLLVLLGLLTWLGTLAQISSAQMVFPYTGSRIGTWLASRGLTPACVRAHAACAWLPCAPGDAACYKLQGSCAMKA